MLRIIATGKGGAGKTTLVSTLSKLFARDGNKVIVFDTDPSMNLAMTLGIPFSNITTLMEDKAAIGDAINEGRHRIDADRIITDHSAMTDDGVRVVIMGTIPSGGSGCLCSPIAIVRLLIDALNLFPDTYDFLIVDSQAGPEIMGRGLATSFDCNLLVTEPTPKALEVARQILRLSRDLRVRTTILVLNKVDGRGDLELVGKNLGIDLDDMMTVRYDLTVWEADRISASLLDRTPDSAAVEDIKRIKEEVAALRS